MNFKWESLDDYTHRARVFGGWLVRNIEDAKSPIFNYGGPDQWEFRVAMVFVPDLHNEWIITK